MDRFVIHVNDGKSPPKERAFSRVKAGTTKSFEEIPWPVPMILRIDRTRQEWPLDREIVIGSSEKCDIRLEHDPYVSYRHCMIYPDGDFTRLVNLSGERVLINGDRISDLLLRPGMDITIGNTTARIGSLEGTRPTVPVRDLRIIGASPAIESLRHEINIAAGSDHHVLIVGETGSGKELVANAIHNGSRRGRKRMVVVNCASLTEQMADSLLFGHEKGAFTGADRAHVGFFEEADESALFLDELAHLPLVVQAKLLRVLENGTFRRLGAKADTTVSVRVIAATNRDLWSMVEDKQFQEDLLYRLSGRTPIQVPTLRDRLQDVPALAAHFLDQLTVEKALTSEAVGALSLYHWPGNIRQLKDVIEYGARRCIGPTIDTVHVWLAMQSPDFANRVKSSPRPSDMERATFVAALEAHRGNVKRAARQLGISRASFNRYLIKYAISADDYRRP